ncbi:hypothetical protein Vi05172_g6288 [Venturia inaequalis]|nr:hypothetical protein Vi05172_g6288 [Venturia inaequalis]
MSETTQNSTKPSLKSLTKAIAGLLDDTDLSDLVITCQNTSYNVHKAIVCAQSRFFKNACKKGTFKESDTGVIDLPADDHYAVRSMIEFLYTGDYTELEPSTRLLHHVQTYTLAEKCSIEPLKDHARSKLLRIIGQTPALEEEDLAAATRHNYENMAPNDCSVHDILISTIVGKMDVFLKDETSPICNLMAEIGEVGRDVARAARFSVGPQQRKPPPESDLGSTKRHPAPGTTIQPVPSVIMTCRGEKPQDLFQGTCSIAGSVKAATSNSTAPTEQITTLWRMIGIVVIATAKNLRGSVQCYLAEDLDKDEWRLGQ